MKAKLASIMAVLGAVQASGCDTNRAGDLAAASVGDLSHALTTRTSALVELGLACDLTVPSPTAATPLRRRPYLQQVTDHSVQVVWTADGTAASGTVRVVSATGVPVATVAAAPDPSARPPKGGQQWISAVSGLQADTIYCYELQIDGVLARRGALRTAPAAGSGRPVRFAALGDSGNGGADQQAVFAQMKTVPFDFMVHLGDIAYEQGTRTELDQFFFSVYADALEDFAVFPAIGNHEYESEDGAPFREAFVLPETGAPDGVERWYSYDYGDVHFVVLDTERVGAAQAAWLDADLAANRLPWTIAYFHRPAFSSGDHGSDRNIQRLFGPVLAKHHVPLVLSGHDHDYERTKAIDGVTYFVSGGGGRGTRPVGRSSFTAFSESVCHFLYVTVTKDELTVHAIDGMGKEFDSWAFPPATRAALGRR